MDINSLDIFSYANLIVVGVCVCLGYVIKHSIPQISNNLIPLIMGVCGVIMTVILGFPFANGEAVLTAVYSGLISGLASTGLHQAFTKLIGAEDETEKNSEEDVK